MKFLIIISNKIQNMIYMTFFFFIHIFMKFWFNFFYKTSLYIAVENKDEEMVRTLLACKRLDVNALSILNTIFFLI